MKMFLLKWVEKLIKFTLGYGYIESAYEILGSGKQLEAVKKLNMFLHIYGNDKDVNTMTVYAMLYEAYLKLNDYSNAVYYAEKVMNGNHLLKENYPDADWDYYCHEMLVRCYLLSGEPKMAIEYCNGYFLIVREDVYAKEYRLPNAYIANICKLMALAYECLNEDKIYVDLLVKYEAFCEFSDNFEEAVRYCKHIGVGYHALNEIYHAELYEKKAKCLADAYLVHLPTVAEEQIDHSKDFIIKDSTVVGYIGESDSVYLPDFIITIGDTAFESRNITRIFIGALVKDIPKRAFINCSNLALIHIETNNPNYTTRDGVLYSKDMSVLICFPQNKRVQEFIIPETVLYIEDYAFAGKSRYLKKIVVNEHVRYNNINMLGFEVACGTSNISINITTLSIGDTYILGQYIQEENYLEPIQWSVLDIQGNKAFLISKKILDCKRYCEKAILLKSSMTWENSTLRKWLNEGFYDIAFTNEEKNIIVCSKIVNANNPYYLTPGGNDTKDKVFLLSIAEAEKYFVSDNARRSKCTSYAKRRGAYTSDDYSEMGYWWLRSPGAISIPNYKSNHFAEKKAITAAHVHVSGQIIEFGDEVYQDKHGIRPVLWIML